jgi:hypothetical protein
MSAFSAIFSREQIDGVTPMKLKDLKIGTQMSFGLGAILLLVVGLSVLARFQTDKLWRQTKFLYDNPFTVSRAV